ncbi:outer membrane beta-barrel protein [Treponema succinifaciens]|uniref:outer membrane beta-barrel protein n=1 Tax=Treponema succinifaciens TaxID=167 RepID=UPI0023F2EEA1|nr:outer membrane beta-barrel protein [Treponema succinifaciens]
MKKTLIAVAAAAALTATSAFAEITFGAWLRTLTAPVASNGEDTVVGTANSWGWGARTARIDINGVSEDGKAGFAMNVFNDMSMDISAGDRAVLWVKPVDMIKISVGKYDSPDNGLRGDFCYGSWNWLRPGNWSYEGEGLTFDGIWRKGMMIEADPIEGLHAFVVIPMEDANADSYYKKAEDTYRNVQIGFGYAIDGVGKLKAQYIGDDSYTTDAEGDRDETATTGQIGVAFDITAIENLYVTVGARFGIADKDVVAITRDDHNYLKMAFTAGASYQVSDAMKFSVDGGYKQYQNKTLGKKGDEKDNEFFVGAGVDYTIMDGLNLAADVRYKNIGYGKDKDEGAISFLVGVNKSVSSNGSLGIGFQGATNGCGFVQSAGKGLVANEADDFVWAIPVSIGVWF